MEILLGLILALAVPAQTSLVTATSSANESTALTPNLAVDGNMTTRWSSSFVDNAWITLDLGTAQSIGSVTLYWESAFGLSYLIQTSTDNQTWTTAFTQTAGKGGTEVDTFPAVTARYIRMQGVKRGTIYGYSLFEFQAYAPVGPTIVGTYTCTVNLLSDGTFTSTSCTKAAK